MDFAVGTNGYRRLGDWTVAGAVSAGIAPSFLYRASIQGIVSRRVARTTTVVSVGYRLLDFAAVDVHQLQPGVTWSHSRGEVQGSLLITRKQAVANGPTFTGLLTSFFDATPRVRLSGAVAYGERIFDIASLPTARASAQTVNLRLRLGITSHDFVEVGGGAAREQPSFDQRSVSVAYRRTF